jgi:RsiW-degrading membrane proteinase PrsW (M82 family)
LDSANGTFVNGDRVNGIQQLQSGDRLMLGQDGPEFLFELTTEVAPVLPISRGVIVPQSFQPPQPTPIPTPIAQPSVQPQPDAVSFSQLFPIFSTGRQLTNKAYLVPSAVTVAFVVALFLAVGTPRMFNFLLAGYLAIAAFYFVYQLCGKHKDWWWLMGIAGLTMLILVSPVLDWFLFVFRQLLPGEIPKDVYAVSFPVLLVRMFFGAGLMEELLKALPVLLAGAIGYWLKSPWRDRFGVREPLDGILLGAASAVGFTLIETLGQYIPEVYQATLTVGEQAAQLASLQLLIPRVLGSVAGHLAYSGYLGYFIGLSMLRPRQRWTILLVGYLTAAALHALWNATGALNPIILALVGILSYAFLAAAILKARSLSPTRSQNFATRFYQ